MEFILYIYIYAKTRVLQILRDVRAVLGGLGFSQAKVCRDCGSHGAGYKYFIGDSTDSSTTLLRAQEGDCRWMTGCRHQQLQVDQGFGITKCPGSSLHAPVVSSMGVVIALKR